VVIIRSLLALSIKLVGLVLSIQTPPTLLDGIYVSEDCGDTGCLYNIKMDPEERNNLASEDPQMLSDMRAKLAKYQATYFNPDRGGVWPGACETAMNEYGGFWGPFLP